MGDALNWIPWEPLKGSPEISPRVLAEILDGGQVFRWHEIETGVWEGFWMEHVTRLRLDAANRLEWCAPRKLADRVELALPKYLAMDVDWTGILDALPWRSDPVLSTALRAWPGMRILRQPLEETLFCFLCSSTKQIVQIKQMCELTADRFGHEVYDKRKALPTWKTLSEVPERELRACKLGYRAKYIKATAQFLSENPNHLNGLSTLKFGDAREQIMKLPGVGGKIADCVLLFGAGRLEAFPVDTWVTRALGKHYGLNNWKPEQLAAFGRLHFGPHAGLAQQVLFADERRKTKS